MLQSHGYNEKQLPYEESILVPFIAAQPGTLPSGRVTDTLLNVTDLMPTLLSQLGITCPGTVEGEDLSFALTGKAGEEPDSAFLANPTPFRPNREIPEWRGVRTKTHTYVRSIDGPWMLFDNVADPFQLNNLVGQPRARDAQETLDAELHRWLERLGDEFLPLEYYVERFGFELRPGGHPVYHSEVGLSDLES